MILSSVAPIGLILSITNPISIVVPVKLTALRVISSTSTVGFLIVPKDITPSIIIIAIMDIAIKLLLFMRFASPLKIHLF